MKMFAFHCGSERTLMSVFDPFDPDCGKTIQPPYFFYLIQHPKGNVLFDSGAHPAFIDNPESRLGEAASLYDVVMSPGDDVVSKLATVGLKPDDIEHVAHSHLHYDHCGGIEFLPWATFYIQRPELPFAYWPPVYQRTVFVRADFDHPVRWKELNGEYDIFNDGRVVLFPTPGHTPGHQCMLVQLDSQAIILSGDAIYDPKKTEQRLLPGLLWNPDALVASWERIEELQERHNAQLIVTHDLEYEQKTRVAPEQWYE